jgi:hypothetical protein
MARNRFEVVLRFGVNRGHEYRFARVRRENAAIAERDRMVEGTIENMTDHCHGGRVVVGSHPTDPNAVVVAAIHPDGGPVVYKVVTFEAINRDAGDSLEDELLASLTVLNGASI